MEHSTRRTAVLVPIKSFHDAKRRLERELDPAQRAELAKTMAATVLAAADPFPAYVVCDDDEVAAFAEEHGASVVWCPERGLNAAVQMGVEELRSLGIEEVVVSHGDLPFAESFTDLTGWHGVTLVPDRHMSGTNVAVVPTGAGFQWSYGLGSLNRHRAEALRLGLPLRINRVPSLGWDVDLPDDLVTTVTPAESSS